MNARQTPEPRPRAAPARPLAPPARTPVSAPAPVAVEPAQHGPLPWPQIQRCVEERASRLTPIPALDERAEAEADAVARRVVDRIGERPALRPEAGRLPVSLSDALTAEVGSVADVRVHDDPLSAQLAASIGARAFSAGADVYLARGEGGARLLAHEAAHAALHPQPGGDLVHAKLAGTRDALVAQGGARSGRVKRLLGKHWDKLLEAVGAYEALEAKVVAGTRTLSKAQPEMLKLLKTMQTQALNWQKDNKAGAGRGEADRLRVLAEYSGMDEPQMLKADPAAKAARAQAVAMLLPRISAEAKALQDGTWTQTLSLSGQSLKHVGGQAQGGVNVVKELTYDIGGGKSFTGFFKEDKGLNPDPQHHELSAGISQLDPNYGARAVAMTRLDQLFETQLLARTEFATHGGKMGTVGETARGRAAHELESAITDLERLEAGGGGANFISIEDPELQRGMNKLQILDLICGQLDRHMGNVFIETDAQGNVVRITGIDLDMAFGKEHKTGEMSERSVSAAHNYRGMPSQVDAELGRRLLKVDDQLIRDAIGGLLSDEEVEATVERFKWVREKVAALDEQGLLVEEWDRETMKATLGARPAVFASAQTNYLQNLAAAPVARARKTLEAFIERAVKGRGDEPYEGPRAHYLRELPDVTKDKLARQISRFTEHLFKLHWQAAVTPEGMKAIVMGLIEAMITDDDVMLDFELGVIEDVSAPQLTTISDRVLPAAFAALAKRHAIATPVART